MLVGADYKYKHNYKHYLVVVFCFPWAVIPEMGTANILSTFEDQNMQNSTLFFPFKNNKIIKTKNIGQYNRACKFSELILLPGQWTNS